MFVVTWAACWSSSQPARECDVTPNPAAGSFQGRAARGTRFAAGALSSQLASTSMPTHTLRPAGAPLKPRGRLGRTVRDGWETLTSVAAAWSADQCHRLGASIAFYAIFTLAPLLAMTVLIAGVFMGVEIVRPQFLAQVGALVGEDAARTMGSLLDAALDAGGGRVTAAIGIATIVIGASAVFVEMRSALDVILSYRADGVLSWFLRARLTSFALVLAIGFVTLVSLLLSALLAAFAEYLVGLNVLLSYVALALNVLVPFTLIVVLFMLLMRYLPSERQPWSRVWPGAILAAVLFELGKHLLGTYIGRAAFVSAFGAAASVVVIVIWVYYCAQVLLIGAEYNKVRMAQSEAKQ
jgi:membrane protein